MTDDKLNEQRKVFAELCLEIVRENHARGVSSLGALLKPEIAERAASRGLHFDQEGMGFEKFADFLRDASERVPLDIVRAPLRPDWEAVPKGDAPIPFQASLSGVGPRRLKRPWYQAFTDRSPESRRVFDRVTRRLEEVPIEPRDVELPRHAELRALMSEAPERFVDVTTVSEDEETAWIGDFLKELPEGPMRAALDSRHTAGAGPQELTALIRSDRTVGRKWHVARLAALASHVEAWMSSNGVEADIYDHGDHGRRDVATTSSTSAAPRELATASDTFAGHRSEPDRDEGLAIDLLRRKVRSAVDRMSARELLDLRIPLEYLL